MPNLNITKKIYFIPALFFLFYLGLLAVNAVRHFDGNVTGFLCMSKEGLCPHVWNERLLIRDDQGYDGQFYYYIAVDPFLRNPETVTCTGIDAYRYQRWLYPFTVSVLGLGNKILIPYAMVAINLAAIVLGLFFIVKACDHYQINRLYSIFFGLAVGPMVCILRSTSELFYLCFLLLGFYYYLVEKKPLRSAVFFALGTLAKEVALASVVAVMIHQILVRRSWRPALYYLIPFAAFGVLEAWIYFKFGHFSFGSSLPHVGNSARMYPMEGPISKFLETAGSVTGFDARQLSDPLLIANIFLIFAIFAYRLKDIFRADHPFIIAVPIYFALTHLAESATPDMIDVWGYARHTVEIYLALLFFFMIERRKIFLVPLTLHSAMSIVKVYTFCRYQQ